MKITIENTSKIVTVKPGPLADGVPARVWEGKTESGIPVFCLVTRIACSSEADASQFEKELETCAAPSPDVEKIPGRLIL